MSFTEYAVLCLVSALGGAINSVAGGGTLLTFPALQSILAIGGGLSVAEAAVVANATSTVALWPGALAALWGYRAEMATAHRWAILLLGPSIVGGWIGSRLVTTQRPELFEQLVPWLILTAAMLFALQPTIGRWIGIGQAHQEPRGVTLVGVILFQFVVAIYGGYFGAGIGILMLAALAMMGLADIHMMNGLKSLLGSTINGIAALVFCISGNVNWQLAIIMAIAAIVGGYGGAQIARRLNRNHVRSFVTAIGFVLATIYFYQQWAKS